MTTVAFDGETLAADKQATIGYRKIVEPTPKIREITYNGKKALVGIAGNIDFAWKIVKWLEDGEDEPDFDEPEFDEDEQNTCVMLIQDGVFLFNSAGMNQNFGKIKWAIGSGAEYAMGAMEMGATATEAVELAMRLDIFSGMGMDVLRVEE